MPLLAGPPVELAGRRFYDAGVSESVPYRTALAQGATHVLILRSRRDPRPSPDGGSPPSGGPRPWPAGTRPAPAGPRLAPAGPRPSRSARLLARTTLRRESPVLRATFLARESRLAADDQLLAQYEADSTHTPAVFSIRPGPDSPEVSRLATDGAVLQAALESGRAAVLSMITKDLVTLGDRPTMRCVWGWSGIGDAVRGSAASGRPAVGHLPCSRLSFLAWRGQVSRSMGHRTSSRGEATPASASSQAGVGTGSDRGAQRRTRGRVAVRPMYVYCAGGGAWRPHGFSRGYGAWRGRGMPRPG